VTNSLGTTINLTGAQCFVKVNTVNVKNGDATVLVPPALPAFLAATTTGIVATAGTPTFNVTGVNPAAGTKFMVFASPQLSAGVTFNGKYVYLQTSQTFTTGNMAILTAYVARYGALIAGKRVFVKIVQSQAGMQDNGTVYTTLVGA
jgi:hypothetical protein